MEYCRLKLSRRVPIGSVIYRTETDQIGKLRFGFGSVNYRSVSVITEPNRFTEPNNWSGAKRTSMQPIKSYIIT